MSLVEPFTLKTAVSFLWQHKKIVGIALGCVALLGFMLWLFSAISNWRDERDVQRHKEAVNASIEQIKGVEANIAVEKELVKRLIENVNADSAKYLEATNASDAARRDVNAAIERMKQAANANAHVNAADVERAMKGL